MKKIILFSVLLTGCKYELDQDTLSKMKSPVIIIGITDWGSGASISVRDSVGTIAVFSNSGLSQSLRHKKSGDTLK